MIRELLKLKTFIQYLIGWKNLATVEYGLIQDFLEDPRQVWPLVSFYKVHQVKMTPTSYCRWASPSGRLTVENDIYGYEVEFDQKGFLDVSYTRYGLTKETAENLYHAVLGNVPGSTLFAEKNKSFLV